MYRNGWGKWTAAGVRQLRRDLGWRRDGLTTPLSQHGLANRLGVSARLVQRWEAGVRPVGQVYGLALDSLVLSCLAAGGPYGLRTVAELGRELYQARDLADRRLLPYEQFAAQVRRGLRELPGAEG